MSSAFESQLSSLSAQLANCTINSGDQNYFFLKAHRLQISLHSFKNKINKNNMSISSSFPHNPASNDKAGNSRALWELFQRPQGDGGEKSLPTTPVWKSNGYQIRQHYTRKSIQVILRPLWFCVIVGLIHHEHSSCCRVGVWSYQNLTYWVNVFWWFFLYSYLTRLVITSTQSSDLDTSPPVSCPTAPPAGRKPSHKYFKLKHQHINCGQLVFMGTKPTEVLT